MSWKQKLNNQAVKNISLEKERNQINFQCRLIKINIALAMATSVINEKLSQIKGNAFNTVKEHTLSGMRRQSQFDRAFDELNAEENEEPENNEDHKQKVRQVESDLTIKEELGESSSSHNDALNKMYSNAEDNTEREENPKPDFHCKAPLSLDIWDAESDEDDNDNVIVFENKNKPIISDKYQATKHEKMMSLMKNKNLNPLIINDKSSQNMDSENVNNSMIKRLQNPPITMTTSATSHKNNELMFSRGIAPHSADSKKGTDTKSIGNIGSDYYDFYGTKRDENRDEPFEGRELIDNDLIVEEENFHEGE